MTRLQKDLQKLPTAPGVYMMKNKKGTLVYVGKATSLRNRVRSYFRENPLTPTHTPQGRGRGVGVKIPERLIEDAIHEVARVDYIQTPSLLEAVILEANLIKQHQPRYNVKDKDQKSFLYVVITEEEFPKVRLVRGQELMAYSKWHIANSKLPLQPYAISHRPLATFGPFPSSASLRTALTIFRRIFHWSNCQMAYSISHIANGKKNSKKLLAISHTPYATKPCFYRRLGRCPGICTGEMSARDYKRTVIKPLIFFFQGKTQKVLKGFEVRMKAAAKAQNFEEAARLRNQLFALRHVNDVALVQREERPLTLPSPARGEGKISINIFGRIEGYDISHISGTNAVASMVVFDGGKPVKSEYRKFIIKTVKGSDDVGMMREAISRRLGNDWTLPDLILVDGGRGQVNVAEDALMEHNLRLPVLGLAKGFARQNDHFVYGLNLTPRERQDLEQLTNVYANIFKQVRDEAHRFAVKFHRQRRARMV